MKRILVPTDFTELSAIGVRFAQKLADMENGEVHLLNVVNSPVQFDEGGFELTELALKEAYDMMMNFVLQFDKRPIHSFVTLGRLRKDVKEYIKKNNIDFVVMASHGAEGINETLFGSHAEQIVRHSPVPTLVIKKEIAELESIKNIALAGDFEHEFDVNVKAVLELKKLLHAQVHFVEICHPEKNEKRGKILNMMDAFAAIHGFESPKFHVIEDYNITDGLTNFVHEEKIDLLAMGTHQRTGLKRWLHASIAEEVVNHLEEPILTFHM
ncbi:universal stress protein [Flammeovirgaceae bacterium SG7u.111]|nr:universal stress protein [Flammeovirgaceae bacterium SG7u.132]WPO38070.1 universal stress protein [Flammeovirgaceae bacterium SG7u.111]